jgi:hypothetical protein
MTAEAKKPILVIYETPGVKPTQRQVDAIERATREGRGWVKRFNSGRFFDGVYKELEYIAAP